MSNSTRPAPEPATGQPQAPGILRRDFFHASGAVGALALAGGVLSPAALAGHGGGGSPGRAASQTARPAWLVSADSAPSQADWRALRRALSTHKLLRPGQSGYNFAKELFSPQFDSLKPSGVAYCKTAADVSACLSFVTKFSLPVRMRSGGHSYGGWSSVTNGLILDVSEMTSMSFSGNTVTVGAGMDLIDFYAGLAAKGKAVPGGSCPTVGIAGLALGGGIGVLARIYGLTSDNLRSVDIITADGVKRTCDSSHNAALYWASRGGGGGNFGVATSFTFATHNLSSLMVFFLSWPWSHATRVVRAWQSWAPHGPDALWSNLHLSAPFGSGSPSISVAGTFVGSAAAAQRQLDELFSKVGSGPSVHTLTRHSYLSAMLLEAGCSAVEGCDTPPGGHLQRGPFFAKSDFFNKPFSSAGIKALLHGIERLRGIRGATPGVSAGSIAFDALGGAVNRFKPDETAFVHRNMLFDAQYFTGWTWPGTAAGRANQFNWITAYHKAVHPFASGQAYQNYPDPTLANWEQAYYAGNYPQLQQVKAAYDPHDLFRFPQAIQLPALARCGSADGAGGALPDC